tara:strand:+ start:397 stop:840 length:444 start_codon:yes stop_codon:yes gene_type:complete
MKFKEWIYKKNNHWDNTTNKTILDEILSKIIQYIIKNDELYFKYEFDLFRINFYIFAYTQKVEEYEYSEDYEYFNMKYSDDIVNLFLEIKDHTKAYGSTLFHNKETSNNLLDFLYNNVSVYNENLEENEEGYNENDDFYMDQYENKI